MFIFTAIIRKAVINIVTRLISVYTQVRPRIIFEKHQLENNNIISAGNLLSLENNIFWKYLTLFLSQTSNGYLNIFYDNLRLIFHSLKDKKTLSVPIENQYFIFLQISKNKNILLLNKISYKFVLSIKIVITEQFPVISN